MTEQELFKQTFESLHASEDTYEEVLMKINTNHNPKRSMTRRAFMLTLAGVLTCGGTAYAIGNGLFASAFGSKGHADIPAVAVDDGKGGTFTAPGMQFVEASEADVERVLGDAVQHVGLSCEAEGYALTVDDLVMDEQGAGVATFTLTAPGGTGQFVGVSDERYPDYGLLNLTLGSDAGLQGVVVRGASGELFDDYEVVDLTQTTDEELHGVIYFGAMDALPADGMVFGLEGYAADGLEDDSYWEELTEAFVPSASASSAELTDEQGHTAYISPVAITYAAPFGEGGNPGEDERWVPNNIAIQLADGTEYMVKSDDVYNSYCSYYTTEGAMTFVFNRLVDPAQITGATVDGPNDTTLVFSK